MLGSKKIRKNVARIWSQGYRNTKSDMSKIKMYYEEFSPNEYGDIDEQSFSDLNLQSIYEKMDRTYSTAGETKLYEFLKKPVRDKEVLNNRSDIMELFAEQEKHRINIQLALYKLGKDENYDLVELLTNEHKGNSFKRWIYFILGSIVPFIIILASLINPMALYGLLALLIINSLIASKEKEGKIKKPRGGISYAARLVKCGKVISRLDIKGLEDYKRRIDNIFKKVGKDINKFDKATSVIKGVDDLSELNKFIELFEFLFLSVDKTYYRMIDNLNSNKSEIKKLYDVIGEIDALIAVAGYKEYSEYEIAKPEFKESYGFKLIDGAHPLVENVVKNSIIIDKKGIVLTGTNMSGKSTFLRMIGVNIVLAQSFNFVHAKAYKSEFLNYVSSISPEDDVESGKSYYMAEGEAVLRIIKALDGEYKVFCSIDEMFRGTNPLERIVASEKILKYIQKRNSLSIVATHDKELTQMLDKTHDFYHFSEDVSDSEGLSFDYKLKDGVLKTRNAIKLLKYLGYPDVIIDRAYKFIENEEAI
ncbi:MAG: MutS-related protein [Sarcina sp.]